jgi:polysaccharide pyruvyl transferase WcaK-like protein
MVVALASRLIAEGFAVDAMTPFGDAGSWDHLAELSAHVPYPDGAAPRAVTRLVAFMRRYERVYVLGADVLDGHYEDRTVRRLMLAASVARLAGRPTTIVGFSYNATPSPTSVRLMRLLPPGIRILLRDQASLERFRAATGRRAELTADVAFLLEPAVELGEEARALEGWIAQMHELGRTVVAFNAGGASYVPDVGQADSEHLAATYAAELSSLLTHRSDVAVALVAHDHRDGIGEHALLEGILERIDPGVRGRATALVSAAVTAREVKALVAEVDLVCTSRMHLAVAALGSGTPVISIAYQGKFAGLYQHFSMEPPLLTLEESLVPGQLEAFIAEGLDSAQAHRAEIARAVRRLAERNVWEEPVRRTARRARSEDAVSSLPT